MTALFKAIQVILALGILVFVHELGHFLWAKAFHIRVDKFYIFFDFGGKALFRFRKGDTEYGIGWFPLGGYCKIAGMVDESMDMDSLKKEPQPWELRAHPAWQKLLVMAGGVLNNFILAILVYSLIAGIWGTAYLSNKDAHIAPSELAVEMGFQMGDHIIAFDDYEPQNFGMLQADLARRDVRKALVLRGQDTISIYIDHAMMGDVLQDPMLFGLALPFVVDSVASDQNRGALQRGDRLLAVAGESAGYLQDAAPLLSAHASETVNVTILRGCVVLDVPVEVDSLGRIGVMLVSPQIERHRYSALEALPQGVKTTFTAIGDYVKDLKMVATPSTGAYKSVGSFISIGQVFPSAWDWYQFLSILALLSIMLGIMNLLPIPGLDGGHIVFTLYEMVSGRKPSDKFMYVMQLIGMFILLLLMILAFGNDITKLFR